MATESTDSWSAYLADDFTFSDFPPGSRVLDIGFGSGQQMRSLAAQGCRPYGVEYVSELAQRGHANGLHVCRAKAEALPFRDGLFDGVICKVVLPYTDEAEALSEIARVLRPGGVAHLSGHGLGYSLRYLLTAANWKHRVYGARAIVNTVVYAITGRRLPGFIGDTIYQDRRRMQRQYKRIGLEVIRDTKSPRFLGAPVFIYHTIRRVDVVDALAARPATAPGRHAMSTGSAGVDRAADRPTEGES
jgi:SAM-dependent methyltransferase